MKTDIHNDKEGRSERFNLPLPNASLWSSLFNQLLAPQMRLHRYRRMSAQMFEETLRQHHCGDCQ